MKDLKKLSILGQLGIGGGFGGVLSGITGGNPMMGAIGSIQLAVNGLKAQYEQANGYEGKMYTGKAPQTTGDIFRSQAELVAAMSDRRYDNDPAYRQDVIAKLERSNNLEF